MSSILSQIYNSLPAANLFNNSYNIFDVVWIVSLFGFTAWQFWESKPRSLALSLFLAFPVAVAVECSFYEPYLWMQLLTNQFAGSFFSVVIIRLVNLFIFSMCIILMRLTVSSKFGLSSLSCLFVVILLGIYSSLIIGHVNEDQIFLNFTDRSIQLFWEFHIWIRICAGLAFVFLFKNRGVKPFV